ncbi:hypothetical protein OIU78_015229 [Salix suchowensis]|nr:hypothetical protein OIU78_015229 [Salix suchowensis]
MLTNVFLLWTSLSNPRCRNFFPKICMGLNGALNISKVKPKRHLITSGWSTFVSSKRLVAGDSFIFLRGESGEFRVGVHRAMKLENNLLANVLSSHSMQLGILSSTSHAISNGCMFTIYFHPWTSPAEFVIPYDQYMKSAEIDYSAGIRFRMLFE